MNTIFIVMIAVASVQSSIEDTPNNGGMEHKSKIVNRDDTFKSSTMGKLPLKTNNNVPSKNIIDAKDNTDGSKLNAFEKRGIEDENVATLRCIHKIFTFFAALIVIFYS
ncbi:hypothetical protein ACOME3_002823 [Neoechinorhynchus agilis]